MGRQKTDRKIRIFNPDGSFDPAEPKTIRSSNKVTSHIIVMYFISIQSTLFQFRVLYFNSLVEGSSTREMSVVFFAYRRVHLGSSI
jgi:hypothetical protein